MTLLILITLFLIASVFLLLKRDRSSWAIYTLSLTFLVSIGSGLMPAWLLANLQSSYATTFNQWGKRNVIILLGYGTEKTSTGQIEPGKFAYGRLLKTLSLYRSCRKASHDCKIIISGGDAHHHGAAEASIYGGYLMTVGVKKEDLILEAQSMNTWQNAQFTSALLKRRSVPVDRLLLVTSGIHMRRSLVYFSHFGIQAAPVRADYLSAIPSFLPKAYNFVVADFAVHEYTGVLRYHLYNFLGWNIHASKPGAV